MLKKIENRKTWTKNFRKSRNEVRKNENINKEI